MGLQDILRKQFFCQMDINTLHNKDGGVFYPSHKCRDGTWEKQSVRNKGLLKQRLGFLIWFCVL